MCRALASLLLVPFRLPLASRAFLTAAIAAIVLFGQSLLLAQDADSQPARVAWQPRRPARVAEPIQQVQAEEPAQPAPAPAQARVIATGPVPGPVESGISVGEAPYDEGPFDACYAGPCGPGPCPAFDDGGWPPIGGRYWFRGEYLLGWTKGSRLPPLVTSSLVGTAPDLAGVLGIAGTRVLFGNTNANNQGHSGATFVLGRWFDPCRAMGLQAGYAFLGDEKSHYSVSSDAVPIIARPYLDMQTGAQASMLVAHPDYLRGSIDVSAASDFQTAELLARGNFFERPCDRIDWLAGYRYARLNESLRVQQFSEWTAQQGLIIPGTTKALFDLFRSTSEFHGAELGVVYEERIGQWSLEGLAKLALGSVRSRVIIDGSTTTTVPDAGSATFTGGLLAQETNIGTYRRSEFAVMPELALTVGYDLTSRLRATFGYSFLYLSKVARAVDQVDLEASQLPPEAPTGAHRPAFQFTDSDFWVQGLRVGLDYQF